MVIPSGILVGFPFRGRINASFSPHAGFLSRPGQAVEVECGVFWYKYV